MVLRLHGSKKSITVTAAIQDFHFSGLLTAVHYSALTALATLQKEL